MGLKKTKNEFTKESNKSYYIEVIRLEVCLTTISTSGIIDLVTISRTKKL